MDWGGEHDSSACLKALTQMLELGTRVDTREAKVVFTAGSAGWCTDHAPCLLVVQFTSVVCSLTLPLPPIT